MARKYSGGEANDKSERHCIYTGVEFDSRKDLTRTRACFQLNILHISVLETLT
jgi:hypothetical protein